MAQVQVHRSREEILADISREFDQLDVITAEASRLIEEVRA